MTTPSSKNTKIQEQYTQFGEYVAAITAFVKFQKKNKTYHREVELRIRDARRHATTLILATHKAGDTDGVEHLTKLLNMLDDLDEPLRRKSYN